MDVVEGKAGELEVGFALAELEDGDAVFLAELVTAGREAGFFGKDDEGEVGGLGWSISIAFVNILIFSSMDECKIVF